MQIRPLMILVGELGLHKTYLVLEKRCPYCNDTDLTHSPPCDFCVDGWALTAAGEAILQLVILHQEETR